MPTQMNSYQRNKKLLVEGLSKSFANQAILDNINLYIQEGECVSLIGPSGSGKSTIFNIITELTEADKGQVIVNGEISYMQQKDLLLPYKTIIENVMLPLVLKKVSKTEAIKKVKGYFSDFGLSGYENHFPAELSGGMKQRANFLRTYVQSRDLMLLDEPFGALDSITKFKMHQWLKEIRKNYKPTIMLITHDIDEAITLSDRIYVLSDKPAKVLVEYDVKTSKLNENDLKQKILSILVQ